MALKAEALIDHLTPHTSVAASHTNDRPTCPPSLQGSFPTWCPKAPPVDSQMVQVGLSAGEPPHKSLHHLHYVCVCVFFMD